ncbi:hypothetical protein [Leptospira santarosai]|uniref:Putative lipoprotein n=1 Tax=Leptospira santarosai serovar Arenal str. MAVJ 401 TaxID=1049976 RepID=M6JS94_9LEPT|nr:hypothetical protein [Leptospira santarosai]ASV11353.1 hypothetical protein B2G51_05840 [Leptospira santarosai]AVV79760.1 Putative lipoprotein [Leptospira santarosai]EMN22493.1 putative lipoprotein [Leptospira santarosai serovar Arenal str. MAVJ 401]MBW9232901.1 hypothetical protein [Leptospira santarosai]MDI7173809.1 hypothetical protein [Leptospira santarosai]
MRSTSKSIVLFLLILLSASCSYNWGQFKRYSVTTPSDLEVVGNGTRVSGSDCSFLPHRWYASNIAQATRDALQSAPGATGLQDVEVMAKSYQYLIMGCIKVEGTPVREISPVAKPIKKK